MRDVFRRVYKILVSYSGFAKCRLLLTFAIQSPLQGLFQDAVQGLEVGWFGC